MRNFTKYLMSGCIGGGLFCVIFSIQWIILETRPVMTAYFPPFLVGFLSGLVVLFLRTRWEDEAASAERHRMKAIMEIAGAVCHETNQPLQIIKGNLELLLLDINEDDEVYGKLQKILAEVERIAGITKKLENIDQYKTKNYLSGKIIDIDGSCSSGESDP